MNDKDYLFSDGDKDILGEIMNIAFGNATASLFDTIGLYVELKVPDIQVISILELTEHFQNAVLKDKNSSIIEQEFSGDLDGSGILLLPGMAGNYLQSRLLDKEQHDSSDLLPDVKLEKDTLLEIGNILIGACIGKISELLDSSVNYSSPQFLDSKGDIFKSIDPSQIAISMKMAFKLKQLDFSGFLLLLTNEESIEWLCKALNDFMVSYE